VPLRQSRPAERLELKLERYLLARTRPRPPQRVLSRTEHWKSGRGAYATREGLKVDNLRVLLVDDVLTTGATLYLCPAPGRSRKRAPPRYWVLRWRGFGPQEWVCYGGDRRAQPAETKLE